MRAHRASTTAKIVAAWRALADRGATSVPGFHDPFAAMMLSSGAKVTLSAISARIGGMSTAQRLKAVQGFDTIPIRVAVIDTEVLAAVKGGVRQVVILGAGFDTRAFRFDELVGTRLFEVDHPATQELKRKRVAGLPPSKAQIVWTPVDFERDSLASCLANAGHDAGSPTVWIWEGVVMYLADDAVRSTLEAIRARSAPGSTLVLHYHLPSAGAVNSGLRGVVFSMLGEPQIGLRTAAEMRSLVEGGKFALTKDLGIEEQAAIVGAVAPTTDLAQVSRILVASV